MKPRAPFQCCAIGVNVPFEQRFYGQHWKGARGVPRFFVQDCLSFLGAILERNFERKLNIFGQGAL